MNKRELREALAVEVACRKYAEHRLYECGMALERIMQQGEVPGTRAPYEIARQAREAVIPIEEPTESETN